MNTGFVVILLFVVFIVGILVGTIKRKPDETQGIIYVYCDDTDNNPSLLLECCVPIDDIVSRKQAAFIVNVVR